MINCRQITYAIIEDARKTYYDYINEPIGFGIPDIYVVQNISVTREVSYCATILISDCYFQFEAIYTIALHDAKTLNNAYELLDALTEDISFVKELVH